MKVHLPNSAFLGNIDAFMRSCDTTDPTKLEVTFNKEWVAAHPLVLCMTAALGYSMTQQGKQITAEPLEATSKLYLHRMKLTDFLQMPACKFVEHDPTGRFIPLTIVRDSEELERFLEEVDPLLHTTPEQSQPIKYVLSELVRNVWEHSESPIGAMVCAQYFQKTNRISIGVVDLGVGIKETLERAHQPNSHLKALQLALTPGITGTTRKSRGGTEMNAGAGLFFVRSMAKVNEDFFVIRSGDAMYKLRKKRSEKILRLHGDPFRENCSTYEGLPDWPGTAVGIDLSLDKDNQTFAALMDAIYEAYRIEDKKRKKEVAMKKPRFV